MKPPNVVITDTTSKKLKKMLTSFSNGCNGDIHYSHLQAGDFLGIFGLSRGQDKLYSHCKKFIHIDNGYFKRSLYPRLLDGYYRIVYNSFYYSGQKKRPWDRFHSLGMKLEPIKKNGHKIIVAPPSEAVSKVLNLHQWEHNTVEEIKKYTDKPIIVSKKNINKKTKLDDSVWCVVTHMSNIQVEAAMMGIPVITTGFTNIGSISLIECPDRNRDFLASLAYQQWTLDEIASGKAWQELMLSEIGKIY